MLLDFNMTPYDKNFQLFADSSNLEHVIKKPTCFKGYHSCIHLIITNRKVYFKKKKCTLETGISHFRKLMAASLNSQLLKAPLKRKLYRDYKTFDENSFNNDLKSKLYSI